MSISDRIFNCPLSECANKKTANQVLCVQHWFKVPPEIRRKVWHEFRKERGSMDHMAAIADAIKSATP